MATVNNLAELEAAIDAKEVHIDVMPGTYALSAMLFIRHKCLFMVRDGAKFTNYGLRFDLGSEFSSVLFFGNSTHIETGASAEAALKLKWSDGTNVWGGRFQGDGVTASQPGVDIDDSENVFMQFTQMDDFYFGFVTSQPSIGLTLQDVQAKDIFGEHGFYVSYARRCRLTRCRAINCNQNGLKFQTTATTPADSEDLIVEDWYSESSHHGIHINQVAGTTDFGFKNVTLRNIECRNTVGGNGHVYPALLIEHTDNVTLENFSYQGFVRPYDLDEVTDATGFPATRAMDDAVKEVNFPILNRWRMDEHEGTVAADEGTDTTRNGAIGVDVDLSRGNYRTQYVNPRTCMEFPDTANGVIAVADWELPTGDFSLCGWFRSDDVTSQQYIFSHGDGSTTDYLHVLLNGGDLEVRARRGDSSISIDDTTTTFVNGAWYFFCYTVTGTTRKLYVNGTDVGANNTDSLAAFTGTTIGGIADNSSAARFNGLLQDFIVYGGTLASGDVDTIYDARVPSKAVHYDDWDTLDGLNVTAGTFTVSGNQLTMNTTGGVSCAAITANDTLDPNNRCVGMFAVNPDGGSGYKCRIRLMNGTSTAVAMISFEDGALYLDDGDGASMTAVTPSNWRDNVEQRVLFVSDPSTNTAHFWLLHEDSTSNDQYDYLGSVSMASTPDRVQFLTGSTNGVSVFTEPLQVWKTSDTVAVMGDSIATGSPLYSPVPGWFTNALDRQPSQLAFWYAADKYDDETFIVNFGQGGQGRAYVEARTAWFDYLQPKQAILLFGTNDINSFNLASQVITSTDAIVEDILEAYAVPLTLCTIPARPNASDPAYHESTRGLVNDYIRDNPENRLYSIIDCDALTVDPNDNRALQSSFNADNVHFTPLGYKATGEGKQVSGLATSVPVRVPRIRHLRRRLRHPERSRQRRLQSWLRSRATSLNETGTRKAFTVTQSIGHVHVVGHGYQSGDGPFELVNVGGDLPTNLSADTLYWAQYLSDDIFSLHTTQRDAKKNTNRINTTDTGTGTHFIKPSTTTGAVVEHLRQGVPTSALESSSDIDDQI